MISGQYGRNPQQTMNHWKYITLYSEVTKVQNVCREALHLWKYKEVQTPLDLPEFDFVEDFSSFH